MATVAEIEQLQALIVRLGPLAAARRGAPIRAADWNALVAAVVDLARALLGGEDQPEVVPAHDHVGQVTLAWLAPEVRRLVEGRGGLDATDGRSVVELGRSNERLRERVEALGAEVGRVRELAANFNARDAARDGELTRLGHLVAGLGDTRVDVAELRAGFEAFRGDAARIAELSEGLTYNGEPVDVAGLVQRMEAFEEIRERLTRPDGSLLDAVTFERRLAELAATLVTEDELEQAFAARPLEVPDELVAGIEGRLGDRLLGEVRGELGRVADGLRAETADALAGVDGRIDARIANERPALVAGAAEAVAERIDAAARAAAEAVRVDLTAQTQRLEATLRGLVQEQIGALEARLPQLVAPIVAERMQGALGETVRAVEDLRLRLEREAARLDEQSRAMELMRRDLAASLRNEQVAREALRRELLEEIDRRDRFRGEAVDGRFLDVIRETERAIDERTNAVRESLRNDAMRAGTEAATGVIRAEEGRIRNEVVAAARAEMAATEAALRANINHTINEAIRRGGTVVFDPSRGGGG